MWKGVRRFFLAPHGIERDEEVFDMHKEEGE
jgi:hypothetical protein